MNNVHLLFNNKYQLELEFVPNTDDRRVKVKCGGKQVKIGKNDDYILEIDSAIVITDSITQRKIQGKIIEFISTTEGKKKKK